MNELPDPVFQIQSTADNSTLSHDFLDEQSKDTMSTIGAAGRTAQHGVVRCR